MMNTNKNANRVFCILLVISIILIVLRLTPTIQAIKQLAYSVLVPNVKISSSLFSKTGNFLFNLSNIIKVNQENIKENNNLKPIFANVIVREPTQWYKLVIIDKGSQDGIELDNSVVAVLSNGQTCVFGRIVEVYNSTSKVALVTNPLFSLPVQIKDSNIDCVCDGYDNQYLKLSFIPQSAKLKLKDKIVTSPLSNIFEKGINVGIIVDIVKNHYGDYQEVIVEPYTQTQSIYEVAVLVKK